MPSFQARESAVLRRTYEAWDGGGNQKSSKCPYALKDVYAEYIADAVYAETDLNFDHVWLNEHHLSSNSYGPAAFPVLAAIAVQTSRIRVGTAVCCLPFHNPLRVSEDAATVDIISNGRLDLGIGVGLTNTAPLTRCVRSRGNAHDLPHELPFETALLMEGFLAALDFRKHR